MFTFRIMYEFFHGSVLVLDDDGVSAADGSLFARLRSQVEEIDDGSYGCGIIP